MSRQTFGLNILANFSASVYCGRAEDLKTILTHLNSSNRVPVGGTSVTFAESLGIFGRLERGYYFLHFLPPRSIFSRRELSQDYESSYRALNIGFDHVSKGPAVGEFSQEYYIAVYMKQLCLVRSRLVSFYCSVDEHPLGMLIECASFRDSLKALKMALPKIDDEVSRTMEPIRQTICMEIDILIDLLDAQSFIADLYFVESLLCLNRVSAKLKDLSEVFEAKHSGISPYGRSPPRVVPLVMWLKEFYNVLLAKYSLYWFSVLVQSAVDESRVLELTGLENPGLVSKIIGFQKRSNVLYASLFFDTACQDSPYLGHGYVLRGTVGESPKGVESIPPIFTAPLGSSIPPADVYAIVMQISGTLNLGEPDELKKLVYSFDEKLNHTYFNSEA